MRPPEWKLLHPRATFEHLGLIPGFLDEDNPAPARQQLDEAYSFAGGWRPDLQFTMSPDGALGYSGDPPMKPIAECKLRDETIRLYPYAFVAIIQPDGSFEAARMD